MVEDITSSKYFEAALKIIFKLFQRPWNERNGREGKKREGLEERKGEDDNKLT